MLKQNRFNMQVIYKVFLVVLLVGMHGEVQIAGLSVSGQEIPISSTELVMTFATFCLLGYILFNKIGLLEILRERALFLVCVFFCLSLVLSTIGASYELEALKFDIRFLAIIGLFYLLLEFLFKEDMRHFALVTYNAIGVVVSVIGIMEYFGIGSTRDLLAYFHWGIDSRPGSAASVFLTNNVFGNWIVLLICISLGQLRGISSKPHRRFVYASIGLFVITLSLTLSRSSWIAFILTLATYLVLIRRNARAMLWAVAILCVFAVSVFANPLTRERAAETIVKIRNLEFHKISHRFYRWRIAVEMFKEHPYLGIGVNNFRLQQKAFIPKELKKAKLRRILVNEKYNAHNHYLNVLAEQGIFGFVVFICLVGYLVSLGIGNAMRGGNEFFALAIVSYFITAMFEYSWGDYSSLFMFWFVVILNVIERRNLEAIAKP